MASVHRWKMLAGNCRLEDVLSDVRRVCGDKFAYLTLIEPKGQLARFTRRHTVNHDGFHDRNLLPPPIFDGAFAMVVIAGTGYTSGDESSGQERYESQGILP